eukprot:gnl/TRDRNA2_/TRDRNA2_175870_c0_seq5.p2 gnl/TRDRNA2_/TRDRNA2_175870_c0~~gnl/TRDRNA2_/TRDRNA2_175870_c0_seq5.p2  ORF type:complete len:117 (+),score=17.58 gnl/TRDRNA2_/TRDRNA2_175870_c0_seq5:258-608(+)
MNLVCAHHVLLVHPMHADKPSEAVAFEMQAIGRVRRQGQKQTVHIHRFVTRDTVEESLARRHHSVYNAQAASAAAAAADTPADLGTAPASNSRFAPCHNSRNDGSEGLYPRHLEAD